VKSLVRNQARSLVKSLIPSLTPDQSVSIVSFFRKDGYKRVFFFKRKREERMAKEWANKDKYHPSDGVLEPRVQLPGAKASVRSVRA
jgi:hypothetical protein